MSTGKVEAKGLIMMYANKVINLKPGEAKPPQPSSNDVSRADLFEAIIGLKKKLQEAN